MMDTMTRRMTRSRKAVDQSENKDNTKKLEEDSKTKQSRPRAVRNVKKQENKPQEPVVSGKVTDQPTEEMDVKIETRQTRRRRQPLQPKQDQQESQHETGKQEKTKGTKRVQWVDQKDNKTNKKALNPKTRGWLEPYVDPEDNVYFGKINDEEVRKKFKSLDKEAAQIRKQQQKEGRGKKKDTKLTAIQEEVQVNPSDDAEKTNEVPEEMQVDVVDDNLEKTEEMISEEKKAEHETGNSVAQDQDESLKMLPRDSESCSVNESPKLFVSETSVEEVVNKSAPIQTETQLLSEVETMQQETSFEEVSADQDGTQGRDSLSVTEEEAEVKETEDLSGQTEEPVTAVVQEEVEAEATGVEQSVVEQVSSIESEVGQMPEKDEIVKEDVSEGVATHVPTESQENAIETQPKLNERISLNETLGFSLLENRVLASPKTVQRLCNTPKVDLPSSTKKTVSRKPSTPTTIERRRSMQATPLPLEAPKTLSKMLLPVLESPFRHSLIRSETFVRSPCPTPVKELVSNLVENAMTSLTTEKNESIRAVTSEEQTQEPTMTVIQEDPMEEEVGEAADAVIEHTESPIESEVSAESQSEGKKEAFSEDVSGDGTDIASNEMESEEQTQEQTMNLVQKDTKEPEETVTDAQVVEEIKTVDDFEKVPLKTPKKCLVYTPRVRMTPLLPKTESVSKVRDSRRTSMKTETGVTPKRIQRLCNTPKVVDLPSTTKKRVASKPSTPATNGRRMASQSTPFVLKTPKTSSKTLPAVTKSAPVIESPKLVRSETFINSPCPAPAQDMVSDLLESALIEAQIPLTSGAVELMKPLTSEEQIQELLMTAIQEDPKEGDEEDAVEVPEESPTELEVADSPKSKTEDKENTPTEEVNESQDEVPNEEETAKNDLEAPATNQSFCHNDTQEFALLEEQLLNTPLIETGVSAKVKKNLSISKIPRLRTTPNRLNSPLRFDPMDLSFLAAKGRKSVAPKTASPLKESSLINASPSEEGLSNVSGLKLIDVTAFDLDTENRASSLGLLNKDLMDMTLMVRQSMSRPSTVTRVKTQNQRPSSLGLMKELLEFSVLDPRSSSANNAPKDD